MHRLLSTNRLTHHIKFRFYSFISPFVLRMSEALRIIQSAFIIFDRNVTTWKKLFNHLQIIIFFINARILKTNLLQFKFMCYLGLFSRRCGPRLSESAAEKLKNRYVLMRGGTRDAERESKKKSNIPITVRYYLNIQFNNFDFWILGLCTGRS